MKTAQFSILMLLSLGTLAFNTYAQDYTRWSLPEGAKARLGKGHITGNIAYSPDGTRLAMASSIGSWIYDAHTGEELALLTGPASEVTVVSFSPDGSTFASGGRDVHLWDVNTGALLHTLDTGIADSVCFSPDGSTLAGGSWREVYLWDVNTGEPIRTLTEHTNSVTSVCFSPDGLTLASASGDGEDRMVYLWDAVTGEFKRTLYGHKGAVNSAAFNPDSGVLANGSDDGMVLLWKITD